MSARSARPTVSEAMRIGIGRLADAGIDSPARDARKLMAASLGIGADRMTLHLRDTLEAGTERAFFAAIAERAARKPLSHLLGGREFYGRWFAVTGDVLDPRPDTESLVEAALDEPFTRVLDLGTGTGCILVTLLAERERATGVGTDLSTGALEVARRNAVAHGVNDRLTFVEADWYGAVDGVFDLVVSNPPYIAADEMPALAPELGHEPRLALTDENDGLSAFRAIAAGAGPRLRPGGRLLVEIGWKQGQSVSEIFAGAGFSSVCVLPDLDGRDRVVSARWPRES